ncbi:MAG: hypothetical protein JO345_01830 [Streptosporangiaceae bacterium]|nr:hypothetical protein [Streptosporangiaceae bacterium]
MKSDRRQPRWQPVRSVRGGRRWLLAAAAVAGVGLVGTGVALAAASSSSSSSAKLGATGAAPTGGGTFTQQPSTRVTPTGPVGITSASSVRTNGVAKTAMQWPSGENSQILAWKTGSGGSAMTAVTTQLGDLAQTAGLGRYTDTKQACAKLASSVGTARNAPPIPDTSMQHAYATSLTGLAQAAADCRSALSTKPHGDEDVDVTVNKSLMSKALTELEAASKELYTATAEIRELQR